MAVDYFLKIDGIQGESQDDKHKNEIELMSFSWGATNVGTAASGGGSGAGKVHIEDFVVMKQVDKASPKLLEACNTGKHISSAIVYARKQGGTQQEYLKITLSDVLVSGYDTGSGQLVGRRRHRANAGSSHSNTSRNIAMNEPHWVPPVPAEEIKLNFGKIEYEYREQDSKGNMLGPIKTVWNAKTNKSS
jgi:type VI secretion system secreted protein Hcp